MMKVSCPGCGQRMEGEEADLAGKHLKCPTCGAMFFGAPEPPAKRDASVHRAAVNIMVLAWLLCVGAGLALVFWLLSGTGMEHGPQIAYVYAAVGLAFSGLWMAILAQLLHIRAALERNSSMQPP